MTQTPTTQDNTPGRLFLSSIKLEQTIYNRTQLNNAKIDLPQLALAGRSNVGKSSLLNALAQQSHLAKTSSIPGKTRSINFFRVDPEGFFIADLPGYGYARRSKCERAAWGELIDYYLKKSPLLKSVVLLLDCRLPPQELDRQLVDFCRDQAIPLLPVLTKADKANQKERAERRKQWADILHGHKPLPVSSKTGLGLSDLWKELRLAAGIVSLSQIEKNHVGPVKA